MPGAIHSDEIFTVMVSGNTCRGEWCKAATGSAPLPVALVENALTPLPFTYIYTKPLHCNLIPLYHNRPGLLLAPRQCGQKKIRLPGCS